MKKLKNKFAVLIIMLIAISCSNDDTDSITTPTNFSEIQLSDIIAKESQMSIADIIATNSAGIHWEPGTVFIYKTTENHYGKLELVSIDISKNYEATFNATNFNSDGSISNSTSNLLVPGTALVDLDTFKIHPDIKIGDLHWTRLTETDTNLAPKNGAKFYKYTF